VAPQQRVAQEAEEAAAWGLLGQAASPEEEGAGREAGDGAGPWDWQHQRPPGWLGWACRGWTRQASHQPGLPPSAGLRCASDWARGS
jgi:hypothetical protein